MACLRYENDTHTHTLLFSYLQQQQQHWQHKNNIMSHFFCCCYFAYAALYVAFYWVGC